MGRATAVLLCLGALSILIAAASNGVDSYGYHLDELYFLANSEHLAWGYVDHPPLSIAILALSRAVFGDAIWALRLLPVLAVAAVVVLTGLMARRLGAGVFGQGLAAPSPGSITGSAGARTLGSRHLGPARSDRRAPAVADSAATSGRSTTGAACVP